MKRVQFNDRNGGQHWVEIREPEEITNAGRSRIMAARAGALVAGRSAVQRYETELAKLGSDPTEEQTDEAAGAAYLEAGLTGAQYELLNTWRDAALPAVIRAWSFPAQITEDSIGDLPVLLFDPLKKATAEAVEAVIDNMFVDFSVVTADPQSPDPTGA